MAAAWGDSDLPAHLITTLTPDGALIGVRTALLLAGFARVAPRLCAAIVDRLTFGGTILETGTGSYRLAHTRNRTEHQA
ncbi:hypothetical protein MXD95_014415 [Frankia sp. AiPa1]|nr:hypothetical protein [Frankia sp. AiPa1]MCL9760403.1 hypothetical protein [Frankia sp. AiPa1]